MAYRGAILFITLILAIFLSIVLNEPLDRQLDNNKATVVISQRFRVEVDLADTPIERQKGLSNRSSLSLNEGMLFVLPQASIPSFWMKDMLFPLDIIWINQKTIVGFETYVPAPKPGVSDANLPYYKPGQPVTHVLEVVAGYVDKNQIKVGDTVNW